eukprot:5709455-Amphidinium_carterae.1
MAMSDEEEPHLSSMAHVAPPYSGETIPKRARLEPEPAQESASHSQSSLPGRPAGPQQWKH